MEKLHEWVHIYVIFLGEVSIIGIAALDRYAVKLYIGC